MSFENAGSTIMSVLAGIADQNAVVRNVYLERFADQYTQPLVDFLCKAKMQTAEDAFDLVQSFWVTKLLQPPANANIVAKYLAAKSVLSIEGSSTARSISFRQYLLRSISNHFLDANRLKKRHDAVSLEQLEGFDVVNGQDVDTFDAVWANRLLRTVVNNVREECHQCNQQEMWTLFLRQLILPRLLKRSPPGYAELALEMGFRDARSASNAVRTVIRKFQSHMKHHISDYLPLRSVADSEAAVMQEFDEVMSVLSRPGALDLAIFEDLLNEIPETMKSGKAETHFSQMGAGISIGAELEEAFLSGPDKTLYASVVDVEFRWRQLRETSIAAWLVLQGEQLELTSDTPFESLSRNEYLPENLIVAIRNAAKRAAREPEDEPVVIFGLIYLLAIAVGYEHYRRIFSSDRSEKIKARMTQLLELPWLDVHSIRTLQGFIDENFAD